MNRTRSFVVYNGEFMNPEKLTDFSSNSAFLYGESIFETMHFFRGQILFITEHMHRLKKGMAYLHLKIPACMNEKSLQHQVHQLIKHNGIPGDARIRLTIFRENKMASRTIAMQSSYIITVIPMKTSGFSLNKRGLKAGICEGIVLPLPNHEGNKTGNRIHYVRAGFFALKHHLDECFLINAKGRIAESVNSNLFIIKSGKILTPPLTEGCVDGVMRRHLMRLLLSKKIDVREKAVSIQDILQAEEIFLTNVIQGIRWVGSVHGIRKEKKRIIGLMKFLDEYIKKPGL